MGQKTSTDVLRNSCSVGVSVSRAFEVFTEGLGTWWIREFTWSGPDALERVGIEPGVDGKCYEIGPYGFRCDWGRVLAWVELQFYPDGEGRTRIDLEHRGFERHGEAGVTYREALDEGWEQLLARYAAAAG